MPPSRRRLLRLLPLLLLCGLALAWALASLDWCGPWPERPPRVVAEAHGRGALRAGAARVALQPPRPAPGGAGYRPPLPDMEAGPVPLQARALVVEAGGASVGMVLLDLLSAPEPLVAAVRARVAGLGLQGVLVLATHTHSSMGGYDPRLVAEVAGMGRYRPELQEVAVVAAARALTEAHGALAPARLRLGEARAPGLVRSRSGEEAPDGRLLRAVLQGEHGGIAELLVFSAHPTLVQRHLRTLDPDYPGRLAREREARGAGVSLVLQGAAGNASAALDGGEDAPGAFAGALAQLAAGAPLAPVEVAGLDYARVELALPHPDASRLAPLPLERAGETLLCRSSLQVAEVGALRLGPLHLLAIPGEPTVAAGERLSGAAGPGTVVLGLGGGYVGYVETPEAVAGDRGEARRQYFGPALLERLGAGARLAGRAARFF
ncbi:hypothetical protein FGE12_22000 [Aggregicoccus sp. 17bor-14]|uniref:hypothetical protein n=1 Tax=Myxococcaceae TaxID=31 RepID=UPI00129CD401|nr:MULTISPECIES: hypothetical protein [Myxococcaceae]MBF5045091.1 hypothetical protein [Simulacricoccus sp. 17bor-14]MRI90833.1 hypothetical protein [Aggregicoccus sp. 17bor-14]